MTTNINAIDTHKDEVEWLEEHLKEAVELLENIATHTCIADSDMRTQLKEVYRWASDFLDEFNGETEDYSKYVGKLGWVSDEDPGHKNRCGILLKKDDHETHPYLCAVSMRWRYYTPLTPEEVEKYIGYKVIQEELKHESNI